MEISFTPSKKINADISVKTRWISRFENAVKSSISIQGFFKGLYLIDYFNTFRDSFTPLIKKIGIDVRDKLIISGSSANSSKTKLFEHLTTKCLELNETTYNEVFNYSEIKDFLLQEGTKIYLKDNTNHIEGVTDVLAYISMVFILRYINN